MPAPRFVGSEVKRVEDPRLLRGQARYTDDLAPPGTLHGWVVRSPHAHASVRRVDAGPARTVSGVHLVLTGAELAGRVGQKPLTIAPPGVVHPPHAPLATERVRYVGEPVAYVVAETCARARDAAALVAVDYAPLDAVVDPEAALLAGAPVIHEAAPGNVAFEHRWSTGDLDGAFARAHHIVRGRFVNQRVAPLPLEGRGCLAQWQADQLTLWTSTQGPHKTRAMLAEALGVPEHTLRVIAPEVGGGFGCKYGLYDDELLTVLAARQLGRPVKWVETRSESLGATLHGRGMVHEAELALGPDGRFLGLRVTGLGDLGAHLETFTCGPPLLCGRLITGAYRIPAASYAVRGVFTNRTPTGPYRGAGRPEGSFIIERLADLAAAALGLDPAEIRRRNFIGADEFPYTAASGLVYDSGRYEATLDLALALAGYRELRARQARLADQGRQLGDLAGRAIGIGVSAFVETASTGPSRLMPMSGHEYGAVRVEPSGRVTVLTGTSPHGQGGETTLAQIAADALGVTPADVTVLHGDTGVVPTGFGTGGSRGATVGGMAVLLAAEAVVAKARSIAAHLLEAAPEDLVFDGGRFTVRGLPDRGLGLPEVARVAHRGAGLPAGMDPGLDASRVYDPPAFTVPFGVYVALVEIDRDTGAVRLERLVGVDDVGTVINPLLLEGQLHGGIAQGVAQALWEAIAYDDAGQLLTGSLMDYAAPRADQLPSFELDRTVTPTPVNALGAKGVGEAGATGAPQAVVNAVVDALTRVGAGPLDMPLTPEKVWQALAAAPAGPARSPS